MRGRRALEALLRTGIYILLFWTAWELRAFEPVYGLVLIGAVLGANLSYSLRYFVNEFRFDRLIRGRVSLAEAARIHERRRYLRWYWVVLASICQLFVFAFLFETIHQLTRADGREIFSYDRPLGYVDWLLYTVDCTFKSILDLPEIFGLHLRNIRHHGVAGGAIVAAVRLLIYSLLVTALVRRWNRWKLLRETLLSMETAPRLAGRRLVRLGEAAHGPLDAALGDDELWRERGERDLLVRDRHSEGLLLVALRNLALGSAGERRNAAVFLGRLGLRDDSDEPYIGAMLSALQREREAAVRVAILRALWSLGDARACPPLRGLLGDPAPEVRRETARCLGHLADEGAVDALAGSLGDPSAEVRVAVVRALGRIGDARSLRVLRQARVDACPAVRREALVSLAHLGGASRGTARQGPGGDVAIAAELCGLLAADDPATRLRALDSLALVSAEGAEAALAACLDDADSAVRERAWQVLSRCAPARAREEIARRGPETDAAVRLTTARVLAAAIGAGDDDDPVARLEQLAADDDPRVRECAIAGLGRSRGARALSALLRLLDAPDIDDAVHAARALAECPAPAVLQALERIAAAGHPHLAAQARRSLGRAA